MRITELLEDIEDKNHNGIDDKLEFDLADDLFFFINNDDDVYRRHVYPSMMKYKQNKGHDGQVLFGDAVSRAYESYSKKYPIRQLPKTLPAEIQEQVCGMLMQNLKDEQEEV